MRWSRCPSLIDERGDTSPASPGSLLAASTLSVPRVSPSLPVLRYLTLICFRYSPAIPGISSIIISSCSSSSSSPSAEIRRSEDY
jgi:hypothetical protein